MDKVDFLDAEERSIMLVVIFLFLLSFTSSTFYKAIILLYTIFYSLIQK